MNSNSRQGIVTEDLIQRTEVFIAIADPIVRRGLVDFARDLKLTPEIHDGGAPGRKWWIGDQNSSPMVVELVPSITDPGRFIGSTPGLLVSITNLNRCKERDRLVRFLVRETNYPVLTPVVSHDRLAPPEIWYPSSPFWRSNSFLVRLGHMFHLGHQRFEAPELIISA